MSQVLEAEAIQSKDSLSAIIKVLGEEVTELPKDLYIPPQALKVFLEAFEGPLDLLLYLIKKQNIDILNIPIASITKQYVQYVDLMRELHIDLAAEYLVMAAMLAEIKSRLLLPRPEKLEDEEGGDPRAELIRRLREYERFKQAAEDIDTLKRDERDTYVVAAEPPKMEITVPHPEVSLEQVLNAFKDVLKRARLNAEHTVGREVLSIRERMTMVLDGINESEFVSFASFFNPEEGRMGVVVTLIAILELLRQKIIDFVQHELFAPIYVKRKPMPVGEV
jgi:segregation and condensation protein A